MAQFELHYLRGVLNWLLMDTQARGRRAKSIRQEYRAAMTRAMREPKYRRRHELPSEIAGLLDGLNVEATGQSP